MKKPVKTKRILILAEEMFEDLELWYPKLRLTEAGYKVMVAGTGQKLYHGKYGYPVEADGNIGRFKASDFDAVIIPGGYAPDRLRRYPSVLKFVKKMNDEGRVIAAICHAAWVPISAGVVKGKKMTCFSAIKDDLVNAGAIYRDTSVVTDGNLISSRMPGDLPDFCKAIISALEKQKG